MKNSITFILIILLIGCKSSKISQEDMNVKITREKYGMIIADLDDEIKKSTGLSHGIVVVSVFENYPAKKAGILKGDIITKIENTTIFNLESFNNFIKNKVYNYDQLNISVFRDNKTEEIKLYMY